MQSLLEFTGCLPFVAPRPALAEFVTLARQTLLFFLGQFFAKPGRRLLFQRLLVGHFVKFLQKLLGGFRRLAQLFRRELLGLFLDLLVLLDLLFESLFERVRVVHRRCGVIKGTFENVVKLLARGDQFGECDLLVLAGFVQLVLTQ